MLSLSAAIGAPGTTRDIRGSAQGPTWRQAFWPSAGPALGAPLQLKTRLAKGDAGAVHWDLSRKRHLCPSNVLPSNVFASI